MKTEHNKNSVNRIEMKYLYRFVSSLILVLISTGAFAAEWYEFVVDHNQTGHLTGIANVLMAVLIYVALYCLVGNWLHAFKIGVERKANLLASQLLTLFVVDFMEIFISCAITGQFRFVFLFIEMYAALFVICGVANCILLLPMVNLYRKIFPPLKMLEICGAYQNQLSEKMNGVHYKYSIEQVISCETNKTEMQEIIMMYDAVLINDVPAQRENEILKLCFKLEKRVYFAPKIADILIRNAEELNLVDTPLFLNRNKGMGIGQRILKRLFDVVLSGIALVVLTPIFLVVAVCIKLEDGGPVFFVQDRITRNNKHFMIYKFRSMIVDAEKDGRPHPAGEKDDRITKVGRVIRACRVDELPQLINILKGDMSIVGPRPERWEHCEKYSEEIPEWNFRNKVRGGLTGYAQVYGKYNTTALDKLKLDLIYITNYSLLLDLQIIFETIKILFKKESTEGFSDASIKKIQAKEDIEKNS